MSLWSAYLVLIALTLECCVAPRRLSYTPMQLRDELSRRIPEQEVVILFEVAPRHVALARRAIIFNMAKPAQAKDLIRAIFSKDFFGLQYAPIVTTSALETLEAKQGNCLALASVYVGLARAIGLKSNYLDVSNRIHDKYVDDQIMVRTGHVTAVVETLNGEVILDVGHLLKRYSVFRVIDDIEASAHFYNNRGYELIYRAQQRSEPIDWEAAAGNFRIATRVMPEFVRAWNNLGVACSRLGRIREAAASYRRALSLDPDFSSARTNLEILTKRKLP